MRLLILLSLGFIAAPALGVQRPSLQEQQDIVEIIRDAIAASTQAASFRQLAATHQSDPDRWYEFTKKAEDKEFSATLGLNTAARMTANAYHIAPGGLSYGQSAPAQFGPMKGRDIKWEPQVLFKDRLFFSYTGADNEPHYAGATGLQSDGGRTWPDGSVSIMFGMFEECVRLGHPGPLAYILDHEGFHVEGLVAGRERSLQESEVLAYDRSIASLPDYGLGLDWKTTLLQEKYKNLGQLSAGLGRSPFPSAVEEEDIRKEFAFDKKRLDKIRTEESDLKKSVEASRMLRSVDDLAMVACGGEQATMQQTGIFYFAFLPREVYKKALAERQEPPEDGLANCTAALSHDILRSLAMTGDVVPDFLNACADVRREQSFWKSREEALEKGERDCKFWLRSKPGYITGFIENSQGKLDHNFIYGFSGEGDAGTVAAAMLLARACLRVTEFRHNIGIPGWTPVCTDAVGILNERWNDPVMQDFLLLRTASSVQSVCMERVLSALTPPITEGSFTRAVMRAASLYEQDMRDQARIKKINEELERRNRRIEEANRRIEERRRQRESRGQPRGGDGIDLSPAERAIDDWRRKLRGR